MSVRGVLTLGYRLNVMGLLAAFSLIYVALSDEPWWILAGGLPEGSTFSAKISPFKISIIALGNPVHVPIIGYLNMGMRLSLLVISAMILLGSMSVRKSWSRKLFPLAGLTTPIAFLILLYIGLEIIGAKLGVSIPISGRSTITYIISYNDFKAAIYTPVVSEITREYWIALTAGILSLIARFSHPPSSSRGIASS